MVYASERPTSSLEWAFGDVNLLYTPGQFGGYTKMKNAFDARLDRSFLESAFHKLLLNFTWWVNRKDAEGMNIFQGGFWG